MWKKFISRKFVLALAGLVWAALEVAGVQVPQGLRDSIIHLLMVAIGAFGAVDAVEAARKPKGEA